MTYGIRVWGPTGLLELDENSFTVRIVYSEIIQASGQSVRTRYISIPGIDPTTHSAVCIPIAAYDTFGQNWAAIQYTPIVGAGGITVYYGCPSTSSGPLGTGAQRLLVMRFR